jgi:hypothetical protein
MRQIHSNGCLFTQNGIGTVGGIRCQQLASNAQRLILWVPHSEHPLVAGHAANAPTDLVRKRLKRQAMIGLCQRAAERVAWAARPQSAQKYLDRFLKSALQ